MTALVDRIVIASPLGQLVLVIMGETLAGAEFLDSEDRLARLLKPRLGRDCRDIAPGDRDRMSVGIAFEAYFAGDLAALDGLPIDTGGTAFQREVWKALRAIPAGQSLGYGAMAARLGRAAAARAVGHANGANPISIVIPCHRLVGADGRLTGYGGGLPRKEWLLAHEARWAGEGAPVRGG